MMVQFTKIADDTWSHLLLYGDSRTGKTTLALQLLEKYKLIWLNLDGGVKLPARKLPVEMQERLDVISIPNTPNSPVAFSIIKKLLEGRKQQVCDTHGLIDCNHCRTSGGTSVDYEFNSLGHDTIVVVDHITSASSSALAHICRKPAEKELLADPLGVYKPKLDDWGSLSYNAGILMNIIQNARFNLVCIAQSQMQETDDGKSKILPNFGSREYGRNVANYFDHLVFAELQLKQHKFGSMTDYGVHCVTGSRSDIDISKMSKASLAPFFLSPSTPATIMAAAVPVVPIATGTISSSSNDKANEILRKMQAGIK